MHEQQEILERIQNARQPEDSPEQPPEVEHDPVQEDVQEVVQESVQEPDIAQEETSNAEVDQSNEAHDEPVLESEDAEELYLQLDDREIPLSKIKEWEHGHMMQSDYTRKTQALAEERKAFEEQQTVLHQKSETLDSRIAELDKVFETSSNEINWEELRDYDPSEYLKQKELQEARKAALEQAKYERDSLRSEQTQGQMQAELQRLAQLNPHWIENGQETDSYRTEMNMVREYLGDLGLTEAQQQGILLSGHGQVYLDAAKFHKGQKKNVAVAKQVKKAPVVTKPTGARVSPQSEALRKAEAQHKKYGTVETALALRKAKSNAA